MCTFDIRSPVGEISLRVLGSISRTVGTEEVEVGVAVDTVVRNTTQTETQRCRCCSNVTV